MTGIVVSPHDASVHGGIPRYASTLARALDATVQSELQSELLSLGGDGGAMRSAHAARYFRGAAGVVASAVRHRGVIVHAVTWRSAVPLMIVPGIGRRLVVHALGSEVRRAGRVGGMLQRLVYRRAAARVSISRFTASVLQRELGFESMVIPPALEVHPAGVSRNRLGVPVTILGVGRLVPRKGHLDLVEVVEELRRGGAALALVIAGASGSVAASLHARAKVNAEWLTVLEDPSDAELNRCYERADIFALLSKDLGLEFEGFGIVFLEAASWGLPVVAGRSGGAEDAIRDGETGYLVSTGAEAAEALRLLASDGARRAAMGRAGCLFAKEHSIPVVARAYERLHRSVRSGGRAR